MSILVLASKSPRRSEILHRAGLPFVVRAAEVPEIHQPGETPMDYVRRLAASKSQAVRASADEVVLGADTVVVVDDAILEKPVDDADAARMLRLLSGRTHEVVTGISMRQGSSHVTEHAVTEVEFAGLSAQEIAWYVDSGEPMDKAGAYAIQGLASRFVIAIRGCYLNIVGLPLPLVYKHWKEFTEE